MLLKRGTKRSFLLRVPGQPWAQNQRGLFTYLPGRESCSLRSVKGGTGGGGKYKVSDFTPPPTPTPTYPAPHTAPFPSLHPQTEKVCHRGTNAIFPGGGRRRRNREGKLCACGGQGKKPEASELPSCEGGTPPQNHDLHISLPFSEGAGATGHHAQNYLARGPAKRP